MLVNFFNTIFLPTKINNNEKNSFYIPILILLLYLPINLYNYSNIISLKRAFIIIALSYMSAGLRLLFSEKNLYYTYLSAVSPLILGLYGDMFLIISFIWSLIIKSLFDIYNKNYISFIVAIPFEILIVWWLM